ncbi:hypothetical protein [Emticicia fluvialis]|uniref:hypothetical protein n=1 Tax=Emticicia fluvialis TaxID=2974474 RepID=UPI0021665EE9|nr:hypothetical protein [Emticicia fluvialis]
MLSPVTQNHQIENAKKAITRKKYHDLPEAVSIEEQQQEIESMKEVVRHEKFFFVVSANDNRLEHINGLERWLGYSEQDFSLEKYLSIIHPSYLEFLTHLAQITFQIVSNKGFRVGFREQRYVVDIALKHAKGHYVLCKRALSPWQWRYDKNRQELTHYFNEFTVTNPYLEDISSELLPRILDTKGDKMFNLEDLLRKNASLYFETNKIFFSVQEIRIIRKIAYHPEMKSSDLAAAFKNQIGTINTLKKRIIKKGKLLFNDPEIASVKSIAILMKKNCFV